MRTVKDMVFKVGISQHSQQRRSQEEVWEKRIVDEIVVYYEGFQTGQVSGWRSLAA